MTEEEIAHVVGVVRELCAAYGTVPAAAGPA
jgi:hypothetical protein